MQLSSKKALVLGFIVLAAAISRLVPHPLNFAPLGAMALFGAAYLGKNGLGLFITMIAWFISDLVLNNIVYDMEPGLTIFTGGSFFIYLSIAIIFGLGTLLLSKVTIGRMIGGSLAASVIFFVLSNLGVWVQGFMYPMTFDGLIECYAMAIPFFKNTIVGDLFYSGVLFLAYERYLKTQLTPKEIEH